MLKGFKEIKEAMEKSAALFKMQAGESRLIRILASPDEIVAAYEHVENFGGFWKVIECLGKKDCPLCKAGRNASFRAYIPIIDRTDGKVKIFKASREVVKFLIALNEEEGDPRKYDLKCVRQGEGLKTQYSFFVKDKTDEDLTPYLKYIPPIENFIEKLSREEIEALMDSTVSLKGTETSSNSNDEDYPF